MRLYDVSCTLDGRGGLGKVRFLAELDVFFAGPNNSKIRETILIPTEK